MTGVDALFARALALEDAGRPAEALEQYEAILRAAPAHEDAWHNRGLLLARLGRLAEAEESHRAYLSAAPGSARARSDLADVLLALGRYDAVLQALAGVADPLALVRRGIALACLERFDAARGDFAAALSSSRQDTLAFLQRVAPGGDPACLLSPENIYLSRAYAALGHCDWSAWKGFVAHLRTAAHAAEAALEPAVAFMAQHAALTGAERLTIARHVAARIEARTPVLPAPPPRSSRRIRVGVLSPDYREHLQSYLLLPLFELADRRRFELYAYSLLPDDGSAVAGKIRAAADRFVELHAMDDAAAARAIRAHDVDILVDAAGYMTGARYGILAQRPARVHATLAGFPGSLGASRIEYALVDGVFAPEAAEWSEKCLPLSHTFFLYDFRALPEPPLLTRADYGLPPDAFVFCAFHKPEKISPDSFALWARIVAAAPGSVLWFRALSEAAAGNLRAQAAACGIDPARLVFAPFETFGARYLAKHRLGDLMLDALHHNAITTACDALHAGLPVLTLPGGAPANRAGASLLRAAGLPELVASDVESYVRTAVRLASDRPALAALKAKLAANRRSAPLFDTPGRVRELEAAFEAMLQVSAH